MSNRNPRYLVALSVMLCLIGCRAFSTQETSFIKPLDGLPSQNPSDAKSTPKSEQELCVSTAQAVSQEGHATEAILLYEKAEQLDPSHSYDLELAPLYAQTGRMEDAIQRYRTSISAGVATVEVYNNLAWTLLEARRLPEALQAAELGLAVDPSNARLSTTAAIIHYQSGNSDLCLQKLSEIYGFAIAHHNLALLELEAGRLDRALSHATLATQQPNCPSECVELHRALISQTAVRPQLASLTR